MPNYVLDTRLSGENRPAVFPSGTSVVDFSHDGDGGTTTLYEFTDADAAGYFATLVEADTFSSKREATRAFKKATSA